MTVKSATAVMRGFVAILLLAACAAQAPVPKDRYYRLSAPQPTEKMAQGLPGVLSVDRLRGNGLTQDQPVLAVDRSNPHEVKPFSYHHWIDSPTLMVQRSLADYLRAAGAADKVVTGEMRIRQDYQLSGRIDALEKLSGGNGPVAARLAIEFRLEDLDRDDLLLIKDYQAEIPVTGDDWPALLAGFEQAMAQIFAELRDDIAKLPAS